MYVTIDQLADRPGATELAEVATPERQPIVDADLMDATLRGADRSAWTPADIAIADAALATINQAVSDADDFIDGYLAKRLTLPLATVPGIVRVWATAITRYLLHKNRQSLEQNDPIVRDYRDATKLLQATANGQFSIGADDPATGVGSAEVSAGKQRITDCDLGDFGGGL